MDAIATIPQVISDFGDNLLRLLALSKRVVATPLIRVPEFVLRDPRQVGRGLGRDGQSVETCRSPRFVDGAS